MDRLKDLWTKFLNLKFWQKALVVFLAYVLFASVTGFGSSSDAPKDSSTQSAAIATRSYPVEYLSHAVINPATISVRFGITNDGTQSITPTCDVKMQDTSGTYKGYDIFEITDPIAPGQTKQVVVQLTITKEGAAFADQFVADCKAQTSDTASSAGKELIITDIKNLSAEDGSEGWYWGPNFKVNAEPMTQMDCSIKALDKNGKVVDTLSYRGNTLNDHSVTSYGQDVLWYKDSTKAIVQSINSFDIKCTL
jgi:hypothetical protein